MIDRFKSYFSIGREDDDSDTEGQVRKLDPFKSIQFPSRSICLSGKNGIRAVNNMLTDGQIQAVLTILKSPLKAMLWRLECEDEDMGDFVRQEVGMNDRSLVPLSETINGVLTSLEKGFAYSEKIWGPRPNMRMGYDAIAFREQEEADEIKEKNGGLDYIIQIDEDGNEIKLQAKDLVFSCPNAGAGSLWGKSVLEGAYKHWMYKNGYYALDASDFERFAMGVPTANWKKSSEPGSKRIERMTNTLAKIFSNPRSALVWDGNSWDVDVVGAERKRQDITPIVKHHDDQISKSLLATFLEMGTNQVGSRATSQTLADIFYHSLEGYADLLKQIITRQLIDPLIEANFGVDRVGECRLEWSRLRVKSFEAIAQAIQALGIDYITPTNDLELHLRELGDLPLEELPEERTIYAMARPTEEVQE